MAVLELDGISKSYRTHLSLRKYWILRDLGFSVEQGEIFGFIGNNGAGKTTSIKLSLGLIFPDSGSVRLFGKEASDPTVARAGRFPAGKPLLLRLSDRRGIPRFPCPAVRPAGR